MGVRELPAVLPCAALSPHTALSSPRQRGTGVAALGPHADLNPVPAPGSGAALGRCPQQLPSSLAQTSGHISLAADPLPLDHGLLSPSLLHTERRGSTSHQLPSACAAGSSIAVPSSHRVLWAAVVSPPSEVFHQVSFYRASPKAGGCGPCFRDPGGGWSRSPDRRISRKHPCCSTPVRLRGHGACAAFIP